MKAQGKHWPIKPLAKTSDESLTDVKLLQTGCKLSLHKLEDWSAQVCHSVDRLGDRICQMYPHHCLLLSERLWEAYFCGTRSGPLSTPPYQTVNCK
jgi:hypothetical protein